MNLARQYWARQKGRLMTPMSTLIAKAIWVTVAAAKHPGVGQRAISAGKPRQQSAE
jgi:hypothetical protein